ncbi:protein kinase [Oxalobacteraceae bacterium R-40]|uniref:Protein kinase n=1 Tax=Keguizhuia sedimenti TaxID=3064264 RepID=A0ABU1BK55_9BURK|nr:protein kinase [Oxalobacteraceae bacterium R-40]
MSASTLPYRAIRHVMHYGECSRLSQATFHMHTQLIAPEQKSYCYYLSTWHDGHTLQQHLDAGQHFTIPDVIAHATKLMRAIGALHRRSIIHRDIKPANIHLGDDGELRILDLGVAQITLMEKSSRFSGLASMNRFRPAAIVRMCRNGWKMCCSRRWLAIPQNVSKQPRSFSWHWNEKPLVRLPHWLRNPWRNGTRFPFGERWP